MVGPGRFVQGHVRSPGLPHGILLQIDRLLLHLLECIEGRRELIDQPIPLDFQVPFLAVDQVVQQVVRVGYQPLGVRPDLVTVRKRLNVEQCVKLLTSLTYSCCLSSGES